MALVPARRPRSTSAETIAAKTAPVTLRAPPSRCARRASPAPAAVVAPSWTAKPARPTPTVRTSTASMVSVATRRVRERVEAAHCPGLPGGAAPWWRSGPMIHAAPAWTWAPPCVRRTANAMAPARAENIRPEPRSAPRKPASPTSTRGRRRAMRPANASSRPRTPVSPIRVIRPAASVPARRTPSARAPTFAA